LFKKFDLNKLPIAFYDSTDFIPFSKPPSVINFNMDSLQEKAFNYKSGKPIKVYPLTSALFKAKFAWAIGVKAAGFSSLWAMNQMFQ
jgi:hypothetical protein